MHEEENGEVNFSPLTTDVHLVLPHNIHSISSSSHHLRRPSTFLILQEATPQNTVRSSSFWCARNIVLGYIKNHYLSNTVFIMIVIRIIKNEQFLAARLLVEYRIYRNNVLFMLILYDVSKYKRERPTANEEHIQFGLVEKWKRQCSGECYMKGFRIFASWCCYLPLTFSCVSNVSRMATMASCPGRTKLKGNRLLGWGHTLNQSTLSPIIRSGTFFQRDDRSLRKLQDVFLSSILFLKYLYVCIHECRTSLVAQAVKYLPACSRLGFNPWVWKIPLENGMATHSSILTWRTPWSKELGGLQFTGSQKVRHD